MAGGGGGSSKSGASHSSKQKQKCEKCKKKEKALKDLIALVEPLKDRLELLDAENTKLKAEIKKLKKAAAGGNGTPAKKRKVTSNGNAGLPQDESDDSAVVSDKAESSPVAAKKRGRPKKQQDETSQERGRKRQREVVGAEDDEDESPRVAESAAAATKGLQGAASKDYSLLAEPPKPPSFEELIGRTTSGAANGLESAAAASKSHALVSEPQKQPSFEETVARPASAPTAAAGKKREKSKRIDESDDDIEAEVSTSPAKEKTVVSSSRSLFTETYKQPSFMDLVERPAPTPPPAAAKKKAKSQGEGKVDKSKAGSKVGKSKGGRKEDKSNGDSKIDKTSSSEMQSRQEDDAAEGGEVVQKHATLEDMQLENEDEVLEVLFRTRPELKRGGNLEQVGGAALSLEAKGAISMRTVTLILKHRYLAVSGNKAKHQSPADMLIHYIVHVRLGQMIGWQVPDHASIERMLKHMDQYARLILALASEESHGFGFIDQLVTTALDGLRVPFSNLSNMTYDKPHEPKHMPAASGAKSKSISSMDESKIGVDPSSEGGDMVDHKVPAADSVIKVTGGYVNGEHVMMNGGDAPQALSSSSAGAAADADDEFADLLAEVGETSVESSTTDSVIKVNGGCVNGDHVMSGGDAPLAMSSAGAAADADDEFADLLFGETSSSDDESGDEMEKKEKVQKAPSASAGAIVPTETPVEAITTTEVTKVTNIHPDLPKVHVKPFIEEESLVLWWPHARKGAKMGWLVCKLLALVHRGSGQKDAFRRLMQYIMLHTPTSVRQRLLLATLAVWPSAFPTPLLIHIDSSASMFETDCVTAAVVTCIMAKDAPTEGKGASRKQYGVAVRAALMNVLGLKDEDAKEKPESLLRAWLGALEGLHEKEGTCALCGDGSDSDTLMNNLEEAIETLAVSAVSTTSEESTSITAISGPYSHNIQKLTALVLKRQQNGNHMKKSTANGNAHDSSVSTCACDGQKEMACRALGALGRAGQRGGADMSCLREVREALDKIVTEEGLPLPLRMRAAACRISLCGAEVRDAITALDFVSSHPKEQLTRELNLAQLRVIFEHPLVVDESLLWPRAHVINLARRPDRWDACTTQALREHIHVDRVEAIDGMDWDTDVPTHDVGKDWDTTVNCQYDVRCAHNMIVKLTDTERACAASHIGIWRRHAAGTLPPISSKHSNVALIMEDDAQICTNFVNKLEELFLKLKRHNSENFDICYIGFSLPGGPRADVIRQVSKFRVNSAAERGKLELNADFEHPKDIVFAKPEFVWQMHAYLLTQEGARKLVGTSTKNGERGHLPLNAPVDIAVATLIKCGDIDAKLCVPSLAVQSHLYYDVQDVHSNGLRRVGTTRRARDATIED